MNEWILYFKMLGKFSVHLIKKLKRKPYQSKINTTDDELMMKIIDQHSNELQRYEKRSIENHEAAMRWLKWGNSKSNGDVIKVPPVRILKEIK